MVGNHGMSYIISNLPKVATWRSKGFRIRPLIAEKSTTLLLSGTFGHTVVSTLTELFPESDKLSPVPPLREWTTGYNLRFVILLSRNDTLS